MHESCKQRAESGRQRVLGYLYKVTDENLPGAACVGELPSPTAVSEEHTAASDHLLSFSGGKCQSVLTLAVHLNIQETHQEKRYPTLV